jgi:predicted Fe-Mo cluster-binding NifX family protein
MKVAVTVWDGRISPVFDVAREALILTIEGGAVVARTRETADSANPFLRIERYVDLGVDTVICGAISAPLQRELTTRGLEVLGFVAGEVEEVVRAFVAGKLPAPELSMPGCCGRQNRIRARRGRGGGRGNGWGARGRQ